MRFYGVVIKGFGVKGFLARVRAWELRLYKDYWHLVSGSADSFPMRCHFGATLGVVVQPYSLGGPPTL